MRSLKTRRFRGVAALLLAIVTAMSATAVAARRAAAEDTKAPPAVKLVIDFGDGVQKHFTAIAWRDEMTVLDVMNAAHKHARGIKFTYRGKGATALLTKIDDRQNEGRGRNWLYRVNGKLADRSFAIYTLEKSDTVLWEFGEYK